MDKEHITYNDNRLYASKFDESKVKELNYLMKDLIPEYKFKKTSIEVFQPHSIKFDNESSKHFSSEKSRKGYVLIRNTPEGKFIN